MNWLKRFLTSTIGLKLVMASTGIVLVGFIIVHMVGNLNAYFGAEHMNHYAHDVLRLSMELLWVVRIVLIASFIGHIWSALTLIFRVRAARPQDYKKHEFMAGKYAVRSMRYGGVFLLFFLVYHIAHMTFGLGIAGYSDDVQANFVSGLGVWWVAIVYVLANLFLGMHLTHGIWSMCRTLGLDNPRYDVLVQRAATAIGVVVAGVNISYPLAVLADIIH